MANPQSTFWLGVICLCSYILVNVIVQRTFTNKGIRHHHQHQEDHHRPNQPDRQEDWRPCERGIAGRWEVQRGQCSSQECSWLPTAAQSGNDQASQQYRKDKGGTIKAGSDITDLERCGFEFEGWYRQRQGSQSNRYRRAEGWADKESKPNRVAEKLEVRDEGSDNCNQARTTLRRPDDTEQLSGGTTGVAIEFLRLPKQVRGAGTEAERNGGTSSIIKNEVTGKPAEAWVVHSREGGHQPENEPLVRAYLRTRINGWVRQV